MKLPRHEGECPWKWGGELRAKFGWVREMNANVVLNEHSA